MFRFCWLILFAAGCANVTPTAPDAPTPQYPFGWRGDGTGRFPTATPPLNWSATENVKWSTVVGESFSSPILTEKYVFVTVEPDYLICIDRETGRICWKVRPGPLADPKDQQTAADYLPRKNGAGLAAATPVTDGKTIYAVYANGIIHAVDLNGKTRWTTYIAADQNTGYGRSASPILFAGKLIIHMTNLYAFDPATGKQLWVNNQAASSYGTPMGLKGSNDLIVTPSGDVVRADDGKTVNTNIGHNILPSTLIQDGVIYFGDAQVSAVRLNAAFKDQELWSGSTVGETIGSPICRNQIMYTVNGSGELYAFRTDGTGAQKPLIDGRPLTDPQDAGAKPVVFASLTLAGNYLYLPTSRGEVFILEATPDAKIVKKITMPHGTPSSPVFSGKEMFLRDGDKLYCITSS